MRLHRKKGSGWCLFVGPLRVRWAGRDFRPLFSERYGYRRWYGPGRIKARWESK